MEATETCRRRWSSHDWNVLVVIALAAAIPLGWLTWQVGIVRHRRAMRAQIVANGGRLFVYISPESVCLPTYETGPPADSDRRISKVRELLGDAAIALIWLPRAITAVDRDTIEAFPEAEVESPGVPPSSTQRQAVP
ncbi:MAG TPA: hypothetical protein VGG30_11295 [Pirellulales bacterium]|jgi:hypothetical protein